MSGTKETLKRLVVAQPQLRALAIAAASRMKFRNSWGRPHPFDAALSVETYGYLPGWLLGGDEPGQGNNGYAGCQPSCLRAALDAIGDPAALTFVDLGCGKGRARSDASERPFARRVGVETSADLVRKARANAAKVLRKFPSRPPMEIIQGDATAVALPPGDLVVFVYHSFGQDVFRAVAARLAALTDRQVFLIYMNPVHGAVIDGVAGFRRWFAAETPCLPDEAGFAPQRDEAVIIWANAAITAPAHPGASARIAGTPYQATLAPV